MGVGKNGISRKKVEVELKQKKIKGKEESSKYANF